MTVLVVGADSQGLRCILFRKHGEPVDRQIIAAARQRQERQLIEAYLFEVQSSWKEIDQYVSLQLPHSHTSVRVIATLLKTSAWYAGKPYGMIQVDQLEGVDTSVIQSQIRALQSDHSYS